MTATPPSDPRKLIAQAKAQAAANRFVAMIRQSNAKLLDKIRKS
jgi:hypothetical protein